MNGAVETESSSTLGTVRDLCSAAGRRVGDRIRQFGPALIVVTCALVALLVIVGLAIAALPDDPPKVRAEQGANIVAIASAAFGVVGAIVGAFFAIKSANDTMRRLPASEHSESTTASST